MTQQREITLLIHGYNLPGTEPWNRTHVRLGIQKGQEVVDDVSVSQEAVVFTARVRVDTQTAGKPNFLGPFVHGKPESRFLYLCWGERKDGEWDLLGRTKVPLNHLSWERLDQAWQSGEPIILSVQLSDWRGRPACGSVKVD